MIEKYYNELINEQVLREKCVEYFGSKHEKEINGRLDNVEFMLIPQRPASYDLRIYLNERFPQLESMTIQEICKLCRSCSKNKFKTYEDIKSLVATNNKFKKFIKALGIDAKDLTNPDKTINAENVDIIKQTLVDIVSNENFFNAEREQEHFNRVSNWYQKIVNPLLKKLQAMNVDVYTDNMSSEIYDLLKVGIPFEVTDEASTKYVLKLFNKMLNKEFKTWEDVLKDPTSVDVLNVINKYSDKYNELLEVYNKRYNTKQLALMQELYEQRLQTHELFSQDIVYYLQTGMSKEEAKQAFEQKMASLSEEERENYIKHSQTISPDEYSFEDVWDDLVKESSSTRDLTSPLMEDKYLLGVDDLKREIDVEEDIQNFMSFENFSRFLCGGYFNSSTNELVVPISEDVNLETVIHEVFHCVSTKNDVCGFKEHGKAINEIVNQYLTLDMMESLNIDEFNFPLDIRMNCAYNRSCVMFKPFLDTFKEQLKDAVVGQEDVSTVVDRLFGENIKYISKAMEDFFNLKTDYSKTFNELTNGNPAIKSMEDIIENRDILKLLSAETYELSNYLDKVSKNIVICNKFVEHKEEFLNGAAASVDIEQEMFQDVMDYFNF